MTPAAHWVCAWLEKPSLPLHAYGGCEVDGARGGMLPVYERQLQTDEHVCALHIGSVSLMHLCVSCARLVPAPECEYSDLRGHVGVRVRSGRSHALRIPMPKKVEDYSGV